MIWLPLTWVLVTQSCPTVCDPVDCSPPGSSVHGNLPARILEWVAIPFSRGSSQSRDRIWVSCIASRFFTVWATREATYLPSFISLCPPSFQPKWHPSGNRSKSVCPFTPPCLCTHCSVWMLCLLLIYLGNLSVFFGTQGSLSSSVNSSSSHHYTFLKINLIGGWLLYNVVVVFVIHWHESAMGVSVSPILNPLPPPSQSYPLGLSQCTGFECPVSCIELGLVIYFTYGNIHVSTLFSQIIPSSLSPTESKSLFFISVSFVVLHIGSSGEGNGTPLQYSCLENPMDGGAWWAAVHGVAKSWTQLSDFTFTFHFHPLEKEMATHSSVLAWRIPVTGEPGGLPSMGLHRVGHDWSDLAAVAVAAYRVIVTIFLNSICKYHTVLVLFFLT